MPKPKFNPNAPFSEGKPKFDPSKPMDTVSDSPVKEEPKSGGAVRAFGEGLLKLPTLGYATELESMGQKGLDMASRGLAKIGIGPYAGKDEVFIPEEQTLEELILENKAKQAEREKEHPTASIAGTVAGAIPSVAITGGMGLAPTSIKGMAGLGAAESALYNPTGAQDTDYLNLPQRAKSAAIGGALGGAGGVVAKGLEKGATKLMSSATGLNKLKKTPAQDVERMSKSLLDQGISGTKAGMQKQISTKLPAVEAQLQSKVSKIPEQMDTKNAANAVRELKSKYQTSGGSTSTLENLQALDDIEQAAQHIEKVGKVNPSEALELARQAERGKYTLEEARKGLKPDIGRSIGRTIKSEIKTAAPGVAEDLQKEQALIMASKQLGKKGGMSPLEMLITGTSAGATLSDSTSPYGKIGLGYMALKSPLMRSKLAQGASKSSKVVSKAAPSLSTMLATKKEKSK